MFLGAATIAAGAQQAVRRRNPNFWEAQNDGRLSSFCHGCRNSKQLQLEPWYTNSMNGNVSAESKRAQQKFKCKVKLNFGLSPDFSIQIKVSLSERLSKRLSQKLKSHTVWLDCTLHKQLETFKQKRL